MTVKMDNHKDWSIATYAVHNEAMRTAEDKFQEERDRRYEERDIANKEALRVSRITAEKLSEKIEQSLKEYKEGANEWRRTVSDLIAMLQGGSKGMRDMWGWIIGAIAVGIMVLNFVQTRSAPPIQPPQPIIIQVPASSGASNDSSTTTTTTNSGSSTQQKAR